MGSVVCCCISLLLHIAFPFGLGMFQYNPIGCVRELPKGIPPSSNIPITMWYSQRVIHPPSNIPNPTYPIFPFPIRGRGEGIVYSQEVNTGCGEWRVWWDPAVGGGYPTVHFIPYPLIHPLPHSNRPALAGRR